MTPNSGAGLTDAHVGTSEPGRALVSFEDQRVLSLESYKRNGDPRRTPVIFVEDGGRLYFQTAAKAWKAKRVMRNPRVHVAPSTFRGEPKGDWVAGTVAKVEDEDAKRIRRAFDRRFGFFSRVTFFVERLAWGKTAFFSISLDPDQPKMDESGH